MVLEKVWLEVASAIRSNGGRAGGVRVQN